jgi:hypothetical protein
MHGMHGDLREEVDGASDAWKRCLIDEFLGGERSEEASLRRKKDRGAEGGEVGCFCLPLRLVTRDASGS